MRKLFLLIVLFCSLFVAGVGMANAQKKQSLNRTPKAFQTFYAKFKGAMVEGDKKTVASLTRFPFRYSLDIDDSGTLTKARFIKKFDEFFGGYETLFAEKNPEFYVEAGIYYLTSDDTTQFSFKKSGASYKFTTIIAQP